MREQKYVHQLKIDNQKVPIQFRDIPSGKNIPRLMFSIYAFSILVTSFSRLICFCFFISLSYELSVSIFHSHPITIFILTLFFFLHFLILCLVVFVFHLGSILFVTRRTTASISISPGLIRFFFLFSSLFFFFLTILQLFQILYLVSKTWANNMAYFISDGILMRISNSNISAHALKTHFYF